MIKQTGEYMEHNLTELIKTLDAFKNKKFQLDQEINAEQQQLNKTEQELLILTNRLNDLEGKKQNEKMELDKTVQETECTFNKIAESYRSFLSVLQKQSLQHLQNE